MTITIDDFIVAFGRDDIPETPDGQPDKAKVDWSIGRLVDWSIGRLTPPSAPLMRSCEVEGNENDMS